MPPSAKGDTLKKQTRNYLPIVQSAGEKSRTA